MAAEETAAINEKLSGLTTSLMRGIVVDKLEGTAAASPHSEGGGDEANEEGGSGGQADGEGSVPEPDAKTVATAAAEEERERGEGEGSQLPLSVICGRSVPDNRVLRAGIKILGKNLGPPQHQGFLFQSGYRRWCVLINGKLYEYADDWLTAPLVMTNMFLCNAKKSQSGLKYSLELLSMAPGSFDPTKGPPTPTVYQAESEEAMLEWLQVIEECTEFMITHQPSGKDDEVMLCMHCAQSRGRLALSCRRWLCTRPWRKTPKSSQSARSRAMPRAQTAHASLQNGSPSASAPQSAPSAAAPTGHSACKSPKSNRLPSIS